MDFKYIFNNKKSFKNLGKKFSILKKRVYKKRVYKKRVYKKRSKKSKIKESIFLLTSLIAILSLLFSNYYVYKLIYHSLLCFI
jgi:hypothetical protein